MESTATKKVKIHQLKAYCEKNKEDDWSEHIVVYNEEGVELARSNRHHPEGIKTFNYQGFEFFATGYTGNPRTECYVKINDKLFFEI